MAVANVDVLYNQVQQPTYGVKELVDSYGIKELPQKYIKPEKSRAGDPVRKGIPAIDISQFHGDRRSEVVAAIADAASNWGFFQVVNHGVSSSIIRTMKDAARDLFNLPLDVRMSLFSEDFKSPFRFCTSYLPSKEDNWDWHDNYQHIYPFQGPELEQLSFYKRAAADYLDSVTCLADLIAAALALGLGLESDSLKVAHQTRKVRLNYYPACPAPELAVGISPHSDFGGFTILLQDDGVSGLQVKHKGEWYSVEPIPDSFVVNIADQVEILSNGKYQSAEHRAVVNSKQARMSIATFVQPNPDASISPLERLISDESPACYRETVFGAYLMKRTSEYLDSKSGIADTKIAK